VHGQSLDAIVDALKDRRLRVMTQWREADGPLPDGTPLIERISDEVYGRIRSEAAEVLAPYVTATGAVDVPLVGHVVAARPT